MTARLRLGRLDDARDAAFQLHAGYGQLSSFDRDNQDFPGAIHELLSRFGCEVTHEEVRADPLGAIDRLRGLPAPEAVGHPGEKR
jgi:hypothetical protein